MSSHIYEWLELQPIVNQPYNKQFLTELTTEPCDNKVYKKNIDGFVDFCSQRLENSCSYFRGSTGEICVTKNRIKQFLPTQKIQTKNSKVNYTIVDAYNQSISIRKRYVPEIWSIYYKIFHREIGVFNYFYIIFTVGTSDIYLVPDSKFSTIFTRIRTFMVKQMKETENSKFIICGHSMGCNLALRFGYVLRQLSDEIKEDSIKSDKALFDEHCIIVGSGSSKWIDRTNTTTAMVEYEKLPNIFIFYTSRFTDDEFYTSRLYIDCFFDMNEYLSQYNNFFVLNIEKELVIKSNEIVSNETTNEFIYDGKPIGYPVNCMDLHDFKTYQKYFNNNKIKEQIMGLSDLLLIDNSTPSPPIIDDANVVLPSPSSVGGFSTSKTKYNRLKHKTRRIGKKYKMTRMNYRSTYRRKQ